MVPARRVMISLVSSSDEEDFEVEKVLQERGGKYKVKHITSRVCGIFHYSISDSPYRIN